MVPLSMTLSDLSPRFQGHDIFLKSNIGKTARLKDSYYYTRGNYIPNICNGTTLWFKINAPTLADYNYESTTQFSRF